MTPVIEIRHVTKAYPGVKAVDDAHFTIAPNEFFALLGPSGCGKTTLLRMIAGFETPTEGQILIDGQDVAHISPNRRPVNMVFQSYAVFPHMSVADNVGYGLRIGRLARAEIRTRVAEALEMVRLGDLGARRPDQLSGGQRQRVALARALVKRPRVLLLDEPMSALDAKLREQMQIELSRLQQEVGITFVIVTHDQDEALSMADRIAVMDSGRVCQIDSPEGLYECPNARFVADFIGKVNLFPARVTGAGDQGVRLEIDRVGRMVIPHEGPASGAVTVAVRPEKIRLSGEAPEGKTALQGRITHWAYYGDSSHMFVETDDGLRVSVTLQNETRRTVDAVDIGDVVWLSWSEEDSIILTR